MAQHLIHIGYPKAGSTFLQRWFALHPAFHFNPGGLGGYHTVYEIARPSDATYKYYVTSSESLSAPSKSAGRVNLTHGGAEPYTDIRDLETQAKVCEILKTLFPNSRILITTRGFKSKILSGYSQYVKTGGREHLNVMCQRIMNHLEKADFNYYDVNSLLRLYSEAFGEENLVVLPYELLRDDQEKFIAVLEERLGVEHAEVKIGRVNPSLSPEEMYWYPLISRAVSAVASKFGTRAFRKIYTWYIHQIRAKKLRAPVKVVARVWPDKRITKDDFPDELLLHLVGKATLLKKDPLYAPYSKEYLWEDEPVETLPLQRDSAVKQFAGNA